MKHVQTKVPTSIKPFKPGKIVAGQARLPMPAVPIAGQKDEPLRRLGERMAYIVVLCICGFVIVGGAVVCLVVKYLGREHEYAL